MVDMKRKYLFMIVIILLITSSFVSAEIDENNEIPDEEYAYRLKFIRVFQGTSDGFDLERAPSRLEGIIMLIRLLGEEDLMSINKEESCFTDVPQWGKKWVDYAYVKGYTDGLSEFEFGTGLISSDSYISFVLTALGYEKGVDFKWDESDEFAYSIGLINNDELISLSKDTFTRGDLARITYNSLSQMMKGGDATLADKLIDERIITRDEYDLIASEPISTPIDYSRVKDYWNDLDWFYYANPYNNDYLYRTHKLLKYEELVYSGLIEKCFVYNNELYTIVNGMLYKSDMNGNKREYLTDVTIRSGRGIDSKMIISGNYLLYSPNSGKLLLLDLDSGNERVIFTAPKHVLGEKLINLTDYTMDRNDVYYLSNEVLYKYDISNSTIDVMIEGITGYGLVFNDDYLYYTYGRFNDVNRINLSTNEVEELHIVGSSFWKDEVKLESLFFDSNKLYFYAKSKKMTSPYSINWHHIGWYSLDIDTFEIKETKWDNPSDGLFFSGRTYSNGGLWSCAMPSKYRFKDGKFDEVLLDGERASAIYASNDDLIYYRSKTDNCIKVYDPVNGTTEVFAEDAYTPDEHIIGVYNGEYILKSRSFIDVLTITGPYSDSKISDDEYSYKSLASTYVLLDGDYLYGIHSNAIRYIYSNGIHRFNLVTREEEVLVKGSVSEFFKLSDALYYTTGSYTTINKYDLETNEIHTIDLINSLYEMRTNGKNIYYRGLNDIYEYDVESEKIRKLYESDNEIQRLVVIDNIVYFNEVNESTRYIYQYDLNLDEVKKLTNVTGVIDEYLGELIVYLSLMEYYDLRNGEISPLQNGFIYE